MTSTRIIYLHGFNSSPASHKARVFVDYMAKHGMAEQLLVHEIPPHPEQAMQLLSQLCEQVLSQGRLALVGSSLGGFYATCLAEKFGCKAVLVNPAVRPHLLLQKYLGENVNYYSDEHWMLDESDIEQFRLHDVDTITRPARYLLMLQKGDETLDYRQALEKYPDCPTVLEDGGDHSFAGFEHHLEHILKFCGVIAE